MMIQTERQLIDLIWGKSNVALASDLELKDSVHGAVVRDRGSIPPKRIHLAVAAANKRGHSIDASFILELKSKAAMERLRAKMK